MVTLNPAGISGNDRGAFWALSDQRSPSHIGVPLGTTFLWLDPAVTSPNVMLGITARGLGTAVMRPGDVVPVDPKTTSVRVWNAVRDLYPGLAAAVTVGNVGFLGLKAGVASDLSAVVASNGKSVAADARPNGSVLFAGTLANGAKAILTTHNLTGLRFTLLPVNTAGTDVFDDVAIPADFAAQLDVYPTIGVAGKTGLAVASNWEAIPLPAMESSITTSLTGRNGALTMNATLATTTFDVTVAAPSLVLLGLSALAGTGCSTTRGALIVEGR